MKFIRFTRTKRGILTLVFLLLISILGFSYASFIFSTNTYKASELLIGKLNYGIEITNDSNNTSSISGNTITIPKGTTEYFTVTISSVNPVNSKYTLAYKTSSNVTIKYTDRTPWSSSGFIKGYDENTYSKKIRIVVDNSSNSSSSTIDLAVFGGYSFNSVASISLGEGYVSVTGPYNEESSLLSNRLVDIVEDDTDCITSTSTTCLYGGESLKNYVQYPESDDKTENIWRILGSYNIDGDIVAKLISTKSSTTTTSTLTTDLGNFYNTLDDSDSYIYQTNYFNCNSASCSTSSYSNIGLLSLYEYNTIGGYNSYLSNLVPFLVNDDGTIKEVNKTEVVETTSESALQPTIYLKSDVQVSGSGTVDDPYTLSDSADINLIAYTLNGETTAKTYADLLNTYVVNNVTCKNGTMAEWDYDREGVFLSSINTPDYCTIDFKDGFVVTLTATNGSVTSSNSQTIGYGKSVSFTVETNEGYGLAISTNTCGGTLNDNVYTIKNISSSLNCEIELRGKVKLYSQLLANNPTRSTRSSFNSTFSNSTTGTIYTTTEKNVHNTSNTTVYYYAGNTTNNWVKFGKYDTDYKVYRGYYSTSSSEFKEYSTLNECNKSSSYNTNCSEFTYWNAGDNIYWRIIRTNADESVRLLYHGTKTESENSYISTGIFNYGSENPLYVGYMFGTSGNLNSNRNNSYSSNIKNIIDNWYKKNLLNYTDYFSKTAVYCSDRNIATNYSYSLTTRFYYASYYRLITSHKPTYDCTTAKDAYSASNSSAKLSYPIGLMTSDEVSYAGGYFWSQNLSVYYRANSLGNSSTGNKAWWLLTPYSWDYYDSSESSSGNPYGYAIIFRTNSTGGISDGPVYINDAIRPVISLISSTEVIGTSTPEDPYVVQ